MMDNTDDHNIVDTRIRIAAHGMTMTPHLFFHEQSSSTHCHLTGRYFRTYQPVYLFGQSMTGARYMPDACSYNLRTEPRPCRRAGLFRCLCSVIFWPSSTPRLLPLLQCITVMHSRRARSKTLTAPQHVASRGESVPLPSLPRTL